MILALAYKCNVRPAVESGFSAFNPCQRETSTFSRLLRITDQEDLQKLQCLQPLMITSTLDHKININVVYFDFTKAYDKVPFDILLSKLHRLGFAS